MKLLTGFTKPDLIIAAIIAIFCILGFIKGAKRQFFSILAFIIASSCSIIIPHFFSLPLPEGISFVWGYIILGVAIWLPVYLITNSLGKFIINRFLKGGLKFGDRIWGFCFGGVKGAIIVVLVIFVIDFLPEGVTGDLIFWQESRLITFVEKFNPFLKLQIMENLKLVISALNDPDYMEMLTDDPGFQKLLGRGTIKDLLNDRELSKILKEKDYLKFITHPKVNNLLKDKESLNILMTTDVDREVVENI